MAIQYRNLQAPAQVDTGMVDTGGSAAALELGRTFQEFGSLAKQIATPILQQQGAQAGAAAGATGDPNFQKGWRLATEYGQAYNNAATRSYAVHAEADAEDHAARLEVDAANDPAKFRATFGAAADATIKAAPPEARAVLTDIYGKRLAEGVQRLSAAQAQDYQKQARADLSEGIQRSVDRIARWRASNDPTLYAQADEEEAKLNLLVDGAANDGTISQVEKGALHKDAYDQILQSVISDKFQAELDSPHGDPIAFIQKLQQENKANEALDPAQEQKMVAGLLGQLREHNSLLSQAAEAERAQVEAKYRAGDQQATSLLFSGQLTNKKLLDMVNNGDLKPETARTLRESMTSGAAAKSDPKALFTAETNLLSYSEEDITHNSALSFEDRGRLILKKRDWENGWRGTQQGREAADRIDRALHILPGTIPQMLTEDQLRQREQALTEWYDKVDALPPDQRQGQVISLAEQVITNRVRATAQTQMESLQKRIDAAQATINNPDTSNAEKEEAQKRVASFNKQLQLLQQQAR